MKYLILILLLFRFLLSNAQPDITYIYKTGESCPREQAWYLRVVDPDEKGYHVREFDMVGNLYMEAHCSSVNPIVFEGLCAYYYRNGQKRMQTRFDNNNSTGWMYWTEKGEMLNKYSAVKDVHKDTTIFKIEDVTDKKFKPATFSDGDIGFSDHIKGYCQYPREIEWRRIYDKMQIAFVIDTTGKIRNVSFSNRMGAEFEAPLKKGFSTSPLWQPATYDGEKVKTVVLYTVNYTPTK